MQSFSVRSFTASDGLPLAVLVDDLGKPLFLPNVYATLNYRDVGAALTTTDKVLRALGMAYLWAEARNLDLHDALSSERFLSIEQCEDLAFFLRLDRAAQDNELAVSVQAGKRRVTRLEQIRTKAHSAPVVTSISATEGGYRIRMVAGFLQAQSDRLDQFAVSEASILFKEARLKALKRFLALIPRTAASDEGDALEGLTESEMAPVANAFKPGSETNPFLAPFIQHRNHLVFRLLTETAMRRNELRHVRIEDVDYSTKRVTIRVSKTNARTVPFSSETALAFHSFVKDFLSKIPAKKRSHGYLLTTQDGAHLSNQAINLMFREVRRKVSDISPALAPHALRRTWNDRLSRKIDAMPPDKKMDEAQEKQVRNRLNGWKKNSNMSERYARRAIREKADQIAETLVSDMAQNNRNE